MEEQYEYLMYSSEQGVATITLNNPAKLNALNLKMQTELLDALRRGRDDEETKVIIITGAGNKAFSVGADISVFEGMSPTRGYRFLRNMGYEIHRLMEIMEKPLIAVVNGYCLAGGFEVALACDFIIAAEDAQFGVPEINIGLIPGWGGCVRLARAIGSRLAKEWIMTGKRIPAVEAKSLGVVNRTVPQDALMSEAREFASELAAKSPNALKMAKMVVNLSLETGDVDAALAIERGAVSVLFGTEECTRAVETFIEGRGQQLRKS